MIEFTEESGWCIVKSRKPVQTLHLANLWPSGPCYSASTHNFMLRPNFSTSELNTNQFATAVFQILCQKNEKKKFPRKFLSKCERENFEIFLLALFSSHTIYP